MTNLVPYTDKILHTSCIPFDFEKDASEAPILAEQIMFSKETRNGWGLAAPQLGINKRVFAFLKEVAFNPEIVEQSEIQELVVEGCLSYPNLWVSVKRPKLISVRYYTEDNKLVERELDHVESRVFLHEYDHLDGITMIDRASDLKLRRAIEMANKHGASYKYAVLRKV